VNVEDFEGARHSQTDRIAFDGSMIAEGAEPIERSIAGSPAERHIPRRRFEPIRSALGVSPDARAKALQVLGERAASNVIAAILPPSRVSSTSPTAAERPIL
jgi:hypothetical protein